MKYELYKEIYENLSCKEDVDALVARYGLERQLFLAILSQKIVRIVKRKYYKVKRKRPILRRRWRDGESVTAIAKAYKFSPVLTASFIFDKRFSRREFKEYMKNPESIEEERIREEIQEALESDIVYSPKNIELQRKSGIQCEENIKKWLLERNIKFITEEDAREENFRKTPDFLLMSPFSVDGFDIRWVESKAGFGDLIKYKEDFRDQLQPYTQMYGPGVIAYWVGHLDRLEDISKKIVVVSKNFFVDGQEEKV
jgi:hypothetical protein